MIWNNLNNSPNNKTFRDEAFINTINFDKHTAIHVQVWKQIAKTPKNPGRVKGQITSLYAALSSTKIGKSQNIKEK